jgi:hypothetical protein
VIFRRPVCGTLAALGRSFSTTYVTITGDRRSSTMIVASSGFSSSIDGYGLVGVSQGGTELVVPTTTLPIESPQPLSRFSGINFDASAPTPYGADGHRLAFEVLIGWSPRSLGAYVVGTYDGTRGIYLAAVDVGGGGSWAPALVAPLAAGTPQLTETHGGVPLLALDGRFYRAQEGTLHGLQPPDGAPAPDGPLLWLPSVPDSS